MIILKARCLLSSVFVVVVFVVFVLLVVVSLVLVVVARWNQ